MKGQRQGNVGIEMIKVGHGYQNPSEWNNRREARERARREAVDPAGNRVSSALERLVLRSRRERRCTQA